jgi:hypothetical protein
MPEERFDLDVDPVESYLRQTPAVIAAIGAYYATRAESEQARRRKR